MAMYKCDDCGHLFEDGEQATWKEYRGEYWGTDAYEEMCGCPICKGDFTEIEPCPICGTYEYDVDETYCDECKSDVKKRFSDFVEKEFTKEERELLNELYDGEPI